MTMWKDLSDSGNETVLAFAGQAGFLIRNRQGYSLAVDLCLSDAVEALEGHIGFKRLYPAPFAPTDIAVDCIIATHAHYDHFDPASIPELMRENTELFCPPSCETLADMCGIPSEAIRLVRPGDCFERKGFRIRFTGCDHGSGSPDAVGVSVETDGRRFLFTGDSCFRPEYCREYLSEGPVDVMIAPINGAYGNLNEKECLELANLVRPGLLIPSHFGLFAAHGGDPGLFLRLRDNDFSEQRVFLMTVGECICF